MKQTNLLKPHPNYYKIVRYLVNCYRMKEQNAMDWIDENLPRFYDPDYKKAKTYKLNIVNGKQVYK